LAERISEEYEGNCLQWDPERRVYVHVDLVRAIRFRSPWIYHCVSYLKTDTTGEVKVHYEIRRM